ncbi:alpha-xenorhabdolysin family binary toxin subunit B [Pseudomonas lurida]|uniref:alpha-xenorhabdolysin family binary toxin subunit B n=3 Tax=Pseudomonas lurida TaxID=244566 RepID=UPI001F26D190|nr:alpha-xenorhabdolysin family binary toxin subunit B [Pseudomonas lurida]
MSVSDMTLNKPNLAAISDCRGIIDYYAHVKLSAIDIPALRSDLSALAKNLSDVDQNVNDILVKVKNVVNITDIEAALTDLEELTGSSVLEDYKRDLSSTLTDRKKTLTALRDELMKPTNNLKTMSYASNTYRLQELKNTRANLHALKAEAEKHDHYDELLKKKLALETAIELYEKDSFYDKVLPIINQVDKVVVASESPATFKKELVKEGVVAAKTILKLLDSEIKYEHMLTARVNIIRDINERLKTRQQNDYALEQNFLELTQIEAFEKLRAPKAQYVAEVDKIVDSFNTFIKVVFAGSDTQEIAKHFVEHAPTLKDYANSISQVWLRG